MRWIVAILLVVAGTVAAFRTDIIGLVLPQLPAGLRVVLNLQIIGLLITYSLESISYLFPGTYVAKFLAGERPDEGLIPGVARAQ